jgi:catechol 2,3-dioxygenase-like lactoylglutathione lyase family enzyme
MTVEGSRINLIVLYVRDIKECRTFYERLGLKFVLERHGEGPEHFVSVLMDGTAIELYPAGNQGMTGALRIGLVIPRHLLAECGLPVGTHLLRDPDNRAIEVTVI